MPDPVPTSQERYPIEHGILSTLAGEEPEVRRPFPIERGILISLAVHVLILVLLLTVPLKVGGGSETNFIDAMAAAMAPKDDSPIPVVFQEAPGPARENPNRSPLSDADRRASGGDRSRPKSETPFVAPERGMAGLKPGPRERTVQGSEGARTAPAPEARGGVVAESKDGRESDWPTAPRPEVGPTGPRETAKLAGLDQVIREAARGTVGGEGGAPFFNPDGGFVDSGPLSFDTSWYDWGPYAAEMVRRIKLHWDVPELARLGWKGKLTIRFYIRKDGTVEDARILRHSGIPPFDFAALQAIVKSSPFRPLPADLNSEREGVTVTFFYNLRPDSDAPTGEGAK